jgi:serine/threonine protein kinase/WD40 repeat protein
MTVNQKDSALTIFNNALELPDPAGRVSYLNNSCGTDTALRLRVEKLLLAHDEAGGFFSEPSRPGDASAGTVVLPQIEKVGDSIGRYKLLEQIGEGGCGVVYMAEQQEPMRRHVALKVIKLGMDTKQVVARFEAERQALAMMDHPNIARVLDAGSTSSGRPYFVMELVRGAKITEFCDGKKLPTEERLELFIQVCQAVQHAHQKGIIHRDLKPSNILVTTVDGAPVPKVIDFGIAKATSNQPLTDKTLFTGFQQFIGTPAYMSPEQAEMSGVDVDTRTDLYSLGVVLYELLTGKTPFDGEELLRLGIDQIRRTIREQEPPKPSTRLHTLAQPDLTTTAQARCTDEHRLLQGISGDLDWIVMKCLEKDRGRRYETANNLAKDVERYLKNEPITARPPSRAYQFQKFIRRNKLAFASITAVTLALLVGLGTSTQMLFKERAAHTREALLRQRAEEAERETQRQLHAALLQQALGAVRSGEVGSRFEALDALRRAVAISNSVELRQAAVASLALPDFRIERQLAIPQGARAALDFSFHRLAVAVGTNAVEIRATAEQQLLLTMARSTNRAFILEWSSDGRYIASARQKKKGGYDLEICDVATGRQVLFVSHMPFGAVSFHPTLPRVLFSDEENVVTLRDLVEARTVKSYAVTGLIYFVRFSPSGESFVVQHGSPKPWSTSIVAAERGMVRFTIVSGGVEEIAWHPGEFWMALGLTSGEVMLLNPATGEKNVLGRHQSQVETVAFSPDGNFLCAGGYGHEIVCWDFRSRHRAFNTAAQTWRVQFHRDGKQAAVVSRDKLTFYSVHKPLAHRELDAELAGSARHGVFSPDGRWLAISGGYNGFAIWDLNANAAAVRVRQPHIMTPFFSPDGQELYGTWQSGIARWRLPDANGTWAQLAPLPVYQPRLILTGGFSGDSLVLGTSKGIVLLPNDVIPSGPGMLHETGTSLSQVSPDGRWISLSKNPPSIHVYRVAPWKGMRFVPMEADIVQQAFTSRSDELAVCTTASVTFLDTNRWEIQRRFPVSLDQTARIIFMPEGDSFWLVRDGRTAALHDARTLATLLPLPTGTLPLAVSADGRRLAVSVDGQRLQLWDLAEMRKQLGEVGLDWESRVAANR